MVARDVNSSPTQYRTWIVNDTPDLTGAQYTGLKSGTTPFVDVSAYDIPDPYIMDFSLPQPTSWHITYRTLPANISNSQLAIIDGYVYLFGGQINREIYRAPLNNPADWVDTGFTLPSVLSGASYCDVGDGYIYLIGGRALEAQDTIYRASKSNPLVWTNMGSHLPQPLHKSQLAIADGYIYLFGGQGLNTATNVIYRAPVSNPLSWTDTGATLPDKLYGSTLAIIGGHFVLLGGLFKEDQYVKNIYGAPISSPLTWTLQGFLPTTSAYGQYVTIGDKGYYYGSGDITDSNFFTRIYRCDNTSNPFAWVDTGRVLPGQMMQSKIAIINDRLYLFGGNGNSIILACDQKLKFLPKSNQAVSYGAISRTAFKASSFVDLQKTLGFPPWKTNYDGYGTVTQTPTLWALSSGTSLGQPTLYRLDKTTLATQNSYPFPNGTGFGYDMIGLDGYLWVLTRATTHSSLWKIDPSDGYILNRMDLAQNTFRLNSDGVRYLYVSGSSNSPAAYVIDSITFTVVNTYVITASPPFNPDGVVIDPVTRKLFQATEQNYVWRTNQDINNFEPISIADGSGTSHSFTMLAAGGFIWVSADNSTTNVIKKIDPILETVVATINASTNDPFGFNITDMKYNQKYNKIFAGYDDTGKIDAVDLSTNHIVLIATTPPGFFVVGLTTFGDFLWACEDNTGHVSYIDLKTNTVQANVQVDFTGIAMVAYTI